MLIYFYIVTKCYNLFVIYYVEYSSLQLEINNALFRDIGFNAYLLWAYFTENKEKPKQIVSSDILF